MACLAPSDRLAPNGVIHSRPRTRVCCRYSPEQLYAVVAKVEDYKEFVPWCERSTVLQRRGDDYMEAELEVGFKVFVER